MATETSTSTSTIEDAGPCLKKITIEVPAATVAEKLSDSIDTLATEAELPGFRKGRAPRRLIERKFGSAVKDEAKNQIIASAYNEAVERHELKVVGEPSSPELETMVLEEGKPISFVVEVEVMPDFDLPALEGIAIKRPTLTVDAKQVDAEITKLTINEGELEEQDTPVAGDYLTGRGVMTAKVDGADTTIHDIDGAVIQIPKDGDEGMVLGVMVTDFATQLGTPKPGDTVTITATGPANHENESVRDNALTVTFTVARADRIVPATEEEVVTRYGMESAEQLREAITSRLNQQILVRQQIEMRNQLARHLLDTIDFPMPERLTAKQAARSIERQRMELLYRGMGEDEIEPLLAEHRGASQEQSARELRLFFIIGKAAEALEVKIEQSEVNGRIAQMAMERGQRPEALREQLIRSNAINQIAAQVQEHKTMDLILSKATIEDISPEDYTKLLEATKDAKAAKATKTSKA